MTYLILFDKQFKTSWSDMIKPLAIALDLSVPNSVLLYSSELIVYNLADYLLFEILTC